MQKKTEKLLAYVVLRRKELDVLNSMIDTGEQEKLMPELINIRNQINALVEEVQKL